MAAARIGSSSVPSEWICPLSNKIMVDPVTGASVAGCEASCCFVLANTKFQKYPKCDSCRQLLMESTTNDVRFAIG
jgi:hypothetical protein